ncbi:hypothetical protein KDL01_00530 [Actinospica durhamensis]|uniref:Uncharacterized protein n=1 Tax=Actinospica durhamensis TaxID=1508375 RepID=A0A941EHY8_9ACTN|nr:hypothetical protein [Actinospica durhamensis]MBR7831721.1 hypothetical protein [Actinospica durhamensis]
MIITVPTMRFWGNRRVERRIVQVQDHALSDALQATLDGVRAEYERLMAELAFREKELAQTREEMEHNRLLAEAVGRELARRKSTWSGPSDCPGPEPAADPEADSPPRTLSDQEVQALRGTVSRREVALQVLNTIGMTRPVRARDVAEAYEGKGQPISKTAREGARHALLDLAAAGLAVRLADGSFLPAGSPLLATYKAEPGVPAQTRGSAADDFEIDQRSAGA